MRRALAALIAFTACAEGEGADGLDASIDAAPVTPDAAPPAAEGPVRYPPDRTLSPITPALAARLRAVAARGPSLRDDTFIKVGASATASESFMHCFAGDAVDLDGRVELAPTIVVMGDAPRNPFTRESLAAVVGRSAGWALAGAPSPLEQELAAMSPRFAVIMYGTNDIELGDLFAYADNLLAIADALLARGVVPAFTSIMPRDDDPAADALVPRYNAVVRAVAQARGVPFIDFHRELLPLPDHGLGADDLHPSVYRAGGVVRPCAFTPEGLRFGYNLRNLITLQTLHRSREVVGGATAPDPPAPPPAAGPIAVGALPWTDAGDTRAAPDDTLDRYGGACAAPQDESGPEVIYRLDVATTTTIRAAVFDRGSVDVDLHLLRGALTAGACEKRAHQELTATLSPGPWYLVVDTFVAGGEERGGEYLLTVVQE